MLKFGTMYDNIKPLEEFGAIFAFCCAAGAFLLNQ